MWGNRDAHASLCAPRRPDPQASPGPCALHTCASITFPSKPDPARSRGCRAPQVGFRRHASCYPAVLSGHLLPSLQLRVGPVVIVRWARTREGKPQGLRPAHRSTLSGPPIWPWPFVCRAGIDEAVQGNELAGTRGPVLNATSLKTWHAARPRGCGRVHYAPGSQEQVTNKSPCPHVLQLREAVLCFLLCGSTRDVPSPR